jgi:hypothetical protein
LFKIKGLFQCRQAYLGLQLTPRCSEKLRGSSIGNDKIGIEVNQADGFRLETNER